MSLNNLTTTDFVKNGINMKEGFSNMTGDDFSAAIPQSYKAEPNVVYNQQPFSLTTANKLRLGIGVLGAVTGILVAVHRKSGFWGGVGWWIVGGMVGGAIGWIATSGMSEEKK